jgi:hypothetical protein
LPALPVRGLDEPMSDPHDITARRQEQQWLSQIEMVRHSDRAAVDIGITTLKTAILINSGAIALLVALAGNLWKEDKRMALNVLEASHLLRTTLGRDPLASEVVERRKLSPLVD